MILPVNPANKVKIDVTFLDPRYPVKLGLHTGWDLNLVSGGNSDLGYPFQSIYPGRVVYATDDAGFGLWGGLIVVWHPGLNVWTRYAHHQPGTRRVREGQEVRQGEVLAGIGRGKRNAFIAHLHFDVFKRQPAHWAHWPNLDKDELLAHYLDPLTLFRKFGVPLPQFS